MKKVLKYFVGFLGVIITICGFLLDNSEYFKFVYKIAARSYANAMIAADQMYIKGFILKESDIGFNEISELVKAELRTASGNPIPETELAHMKIMQVKTLKSGLHQVLDPPPPVVVDFIELEVSLQDLPPATGDFRDIKGKIREKYLSTTLIQWKFVIIGTGIIITVISFFL